MEDVLCTFLKPETIQRLQKRARTHPHARRYLLMLRLAVLLISQAQGEEEEAPESIDWAIQTTTQNLCAMFPGDSNGAATILAELSGDVALDYCQRRARVTRASKTALLLRLSEKMER